MHKVIGKRVQRVDGYEKVTGKAIYGDDTVFPKMLHAACRFSDIVCGKIKSIDVEKAKKMHGVEAIGLYDNVPGAKKIGAIRQDYLPLVHDKIYFRGDVIAVVAALTKEQAYAAAEAIEIEYEQEDGIFDVREAVKPDAKLVHPEYKSNVVIHYPLRKGNVEKGFNESDHVITRTYQTGFHEHAYIEPESIVVTYDPNTNGYKIYGSIQNPFTTRKAVSMFMGLRLNQINVFSSTLGGSFGGKDDIVNNIACRAALLCKMTGKPVKLTYTREESLRESYKRHPYHMTYKVGFTKDGILKAMQINILADSGAYSSQTFFVTWRSVVQATGPYEIPNVCTDVRGVYTNNVYTAAFRGFGSPQVIYAQESLMDEIAEICNISPYEIRKKNGYKQGSITASNQILSEHKVSLQQVIDEAVKKSDYHNKYENYQIENKSNNRYKKGIGLSCSFRGCSLGAEGTDASSAIVSVQADGSVYVFTGVNENGQGLRTTFCQMVSEILGVELENIVFLEPQTATITDGGPTVASRGTIVGGNATIEAANIVKKRIFEIIKDDLQVTSLQDIKWENGRIISLNDKNLSICFETAAEKAYFAGVNLSAYGWFKAPDVSWDEETGQGNAYFTYVYGCQVAELVVDTHTGKIEVESITAAHDVGRVINKIGAEGQVYGGVTQGAGYAYLEDYNLQKGVLKSENFDTYLIPTIRDVKKIHPILVENPDKYGPFGAKGIGEPTLELGAAAINNAIAYALKKRFYQLPLTLEQVYLGRNLRKPQRQSELKQNKKLSHRVSDLNTINPDSIQHALELLSEDNTSILAGGTDVLVQSRLQSEPQKLINISCLNDLKGIQESENDITIYGCTTFTSLLENSSIKKYFPILWQACSKIGSTQIRNRATIAGNIANAAPCADSVPPLVLYDATAILKSLTREREVKISDLVKGSYQTEIKNDEIITEIVIPKLSHKYFSHYYQLGRRNAVNITRMSISILLSADKDIVNECRIVDGSLFSKPQRFSSIESLIINKSFTKELIFSLKEPLNNLISAEIGKRWSSAYKIPVFVDLCVNGLLQILQEYNKG